MPIFPNRIYRISPYPPLLVDGFRSSARFNSEHTIIRYAALTVGDCMHEINVHDGISPVFDLHILEFLPNLKIEKLHLEDLKKGWEEDESYTQKIGDKFIEEGKAALCYVPSALLPYTTNVLINPLHADIASFLVKSEVIITKPRLVTERGIETLRRKMLEKAEKTFGSKVKATKWLGLQNIHLKGETPLELMNSSEGLIKIDELLRKV